MKAYPVSGMCILEEEETGSFHTYLTRGCRLCREGAKMVLFVTGLCDRDCFYCPVSEERRRTQVYANEQPVSGDADILDEAKRMDAKGTGITGGEPLLEKELVLYYIRLLKGEFGPDHHIHLYTASHPGDKTIAELAEAGLDEIRFHPPIALWDRLEHSPYRDSLKAAERAGIEAGLELPSIAGAGEAVAFAGRRGCFVNLNELEFSDANAGELKARGYELGDDISNAVKGSEEIARRALGNTSKGHFCPSRYKDAVQLRKRLIRMANNTGRVLDIITEDGTIVFGVIHAQNPVDVAVQLRDMAVPEELYEIKRDSVEIAAWVLEEISGEIRHSSGMEIVEKYPLKNGIIVESIPV